jgi:hypothetical protein
MGDAFMFALLALATSSIAVTAADMPDVPKIGRDVGQMFPQIVLPSLDGKRTLALSDFRGKKVLLIEFASW